MQAKGLGKARLRDALTGAALGALFPAAATLLVTVFAAGTVVLLAIIGLAVPVLALAGWLVGRRRDDIAAMTADLEHTIAKRTAAMRSMLDVTGDGFLTFGPDYVIRPEYSKPCETLFGGPIAGRRLPELLYAEEQPRRDFTDGLDLLFAGKAKPEVIFDLLDKRIEVGDRTLSIAYRAIDEATVLCAFTDITTAERLEKTVLEQDRRRTLILRAVSNQKYFAGFVEQANELFRVLDSGAFDHQDGVSRDASEKLAAQVHSFKGNAGFLGFTRTETVAHDLEDRLTALPVLQSDTDLSSEVFVLKRQFYEEYNAIAETLGEQWINDLSSIRVPATALKKVEAYARSRHPDDRALTTALEQLRSVPAAALFSRFPQLVADIAARRGRRIKPVEIAGGGFRVMPERFEPLVNALEHIVRNMVDHGIESPAERELKGKPAAGEVRVEISRAPGEMVITMSDDGQGISFAAVEELARERGMLEEEARPSRNELLALLFSSGFSTSDEVTVTSGRGVGLSAVRQAVRRLGGKITVETRPGRGATFRIRAPL